MTPGRGPTRWLDRLRLARPAAKDSVRWEIEHHLSEVADRLVEQGWGVEEARAEAERRFGDQGRYGAPMRRMEQGRVAMEMRTRILDLLVESVASVGRAARREPGVTLGVILTLGLGIGANATMYGIVDRLLLQPPEHVADHERVRLVFQERPSFNGPGMSVSSTITYPDYVDLRAHEGLDVAGYGLARPATIGSGESARKLQRAEVTAGFFELLGVQPRMGRFFTESEATAGSALTAVISEEYWAREFASDPAVLGRTLEVNGGLASVVGVAPRGFTGTGLAPVDLWMPLEATHASERGGDGCLASRGCWWMQAVTRLRDGVSVEAAEAEATRLHLNGRSELIEQGRFPAQVRLMLGPVIAAQGPQASDETRVARWLAGVSLVVLLIACANVANLMMARGIRRRREVGVRMALGSSRRRLVLQAMTETLMLASVGALLALAIARWGGAFVRAALLPGVYFPNESWSGRLLLFTGVAAVVAGALAGLGPALQNRRTDLTVTLGEGMRGSSRASSRVRGLLTVAQAGMSVVLLVGAGLFVRSLGELRSLDLGLDVDRLLMAQLEFTTSLDEADQNAIYEEAARMVATIPGVASAAPMGVPFQWGYAEALRVPGIDSLPRLPGGGPYYFPVTTDYFRTVGLAVLQGRGIEASDVETAERVAVVSATMARTLWPEDRALGQCLVVGNETEECTTVVGVVEDAARGGYEDEPFMAYYLPSSQFAMAHNGMYVRVEGEGADPALAVAAALRTLSPQIRFAAVDPLRELLDPQARAWRLGAMMFSVFGLLALGLAAIGLYSVLAFDVAQRTREIGIRSALGAQKAELLRSVLVQGSRLAVLGVVLGGGAAWLAAPFVGELLFQVSPRDPAVLGSVALVLVAVGVAASLIPGLRATGVDPLDALRAE